MNITLFFVLILVTVFRLTGAHVNNNSNNNNIVNANYNIAYNDSRHGIFTNTTTRKMMRYNLLKGYPGLFTKYWFAWCRVVSRLMLWVILTLEFPVFLLLALFILYALYTMIRIKLWSQYNTITNKTRIETRRNKSRSSLSSSSSSDDDTGTNSSLDLDSGEMGSEGSTLCVPTPSFTSHLQQFLSGIRIFGYLEKPVFHELTKNMKTQTMEEGELLVLDKFAGFPILVEGTLEIYYELDDSVSEKEEEVEEEEEEEDDDEKKNNRAGVGVRCTPDFPHGCEQECSTNLDSDSDYTVDSGYIYLRDGLGKFQLLNVLKPGNPVSSLIDILTLFTSHPGDNIGKLKPALVSPLIMARAATNATIAIIPSEAFVTLTDKYPRAASHIIRIILTKLYHVTFKTANEYLGMTREIMKIELLLNKLATHGIPEHLRKTALRMLSEREHYGLPPMSIDNSNTETVKRGRPVTLRSTSSTRHIYINSRDKFNPGDLVSHVPIQTRDIGMTEPCLSSLSPTHNQAKTHEREHCVMDDTCIQEEETEEHAVRMAISEAILEYLGVKSIDYQGGEVLSEISSELRHTVNTEPLYSLPSPASSFGLDSYHSGSNDSPLRAILEGRSNVSGSLLKILPNNYFIGPTRRSRSGIRAHMNDSNSKSEGKRNCNELQTTREDMRKNIDSVKREFSQSLQLKMFKRGTRIVEQRSGDGKGLFYILKGKISVSFDKLSPGGRTHQIHLFTLGEGDLGGYLSSLIGYRSFANLTAKTDVYVGFLPNADIERLCEKYFFLYLRLAETLISLLQPILLKLDHALEWVHLDASETLFKEGDPANGIYLILNGRLRQYQKRRTARVSGSNSGGTPPRDNAIGELTQGESLGEVEVLTATNRDSTVVAVRETELARISRALFEVLAMEHPSIMVRVSRLVARKIMENKSVSLDSSYAGNMANIKITKSSPTSDSANYRTISILPVTENLPMEEFATKFISALKQVGRTTIGLNQSLTLTHLGRHAFDRYAKLKQSGFFADLEQQYQMVVYIGDSSINSSWNKTCISRGDCILLLADATAVPRVSKEYKKLLLGSKSTANMKLILLHPEPYVTPGLTHKWLINRPWINSHHHVQFSLPRVKIKDSFSKGNSLNGTIEKLTQGDSTRRTQRNISKFLPFSIKNFSARFLVREKRPFYNQMHRHKDDFLRLARLLSGQAIGLVLGGGGARGISHLGIIQAIEEQGIPIDIVGGTSIGSFIGGLYARDYNVVSIYGRIKQFSARISSKWRMILDLTWPVTSYTTGHEFNRGIWKTFGETKIEDFWLPFYCNSTNITDSVEEIHTHGYAWRYIRASMSLAGLLPPLEDDGSMLLDGGYVDNLPVSEMKKRGCATVFAVDVGSVDDKTPMRYGDSLNGFWIVFNRWNPFSKHPNIPSMVEIQTRLGYVASVNALEEAKKTKGVVYIRPPVEGYDTLAFSKFEELYQLGVGYGRKFIQSLAEGNKMPQLPGTSSLPTKEPAIPEFLLHRRNSI